MHRTYPASATMAHIRDWLARGDLRHECSRDGTGTVRHTWAVAPGANVRAIWRAIKRLTDAECDALARDAMIAVAEFN